MLTGKSCNGFTIVSESSDPPFSSENWSLPIVTLGTGKDGQHYLFHFQTSLKLLASILHPEVSANLSGAPVSNQQIVIESYVMTAFERLTNDLSEEQIEQSQSDSGCVVPFVEGLMVSN